MSLHHGDMKSLLYYSPMLYRSIDWLLGSTRLKLNNPSLILTSNMNAFFGHTRSTIPLQGI
jgi:hypothetical protein